VADSTKEAAKKTADTVKDKTKKATDTVKDKAKKATDTVKDKTQKATDTVKDKAKAGTEKATDNVKTTAEKVATSVKSAFEKMEDFTEATVKAAKTAAAKTAAKYKVQPNVCVQYDGGEYLVDEIIERVKTQYAAEGRTDAIRDINVYIKPEDGMAYYVINGRCAGKVQL